MSGRKLSFQDDENPKKKPRLLEGVPRAASSPLACFDDLNNDCLVNILTNLSSEDMNTVAICSKACREAKSNESLDQTRTGTIVLSNNTTGLFLYDAIIDGDWTNVFTGDRSKLIVENITNLTGGHETAYWIASFPQLEGVYGLDLSCPSEDNVGRIIEAEQLGAFFELFPNLNEIDLSGLKVLSASGREPVTVRFSKPFPCLQRLTWNHSERNVHLSGYDFPEALTDLVVDKSCFRSSYGSREDVEREYESGGNDRILFCCGYLERLCIKDASFACNLNISTERFPVTQNMLIKMVRNQASLKWLRSDLTPENIVMLQQERPEITFVSE